MKRPPRVAARTVPGPMSLPRARIQPPRLSTPPSSMGIALRVVSGRTENVDRRTLDPRDVGELGTGRDFPARRAVARVQRDPLRRLREILRGARARAQRRAATHRASSARASLPRRGKHDRRRSRGPRRPAARNRTRHPSRSRETGRPAHPRAASRCGSRTPATAPSGACPLDCRGGSARDRTRRDASRVTARHPRRCRDARIATAARSRRRTR